MTSVDAAQDHIHSIGSKRSSIHLAIPPSFLSLLLICFSPSYHHHYSIYSFSPSLDRSTLQQKAVYTHSPAGTVAAGRLVGELGPDPLVPPSSTALPAAQARHCILL